MRVDVVGNVNEVRRMDIAGRCVVVIDVLRTTSTIVTALAYDAADVIAVETVPQAKQLNVKDAIRGGERFDKKITGFEVGNSPYEYMTPNIAGKTIILTTTDGTRALIKASKARHVFAGSFLNVKAVAAVLCELRRDILLLCAGDQDEFALEDGLCAGSIIEELYRQSPFPIMLNDLGLALHQAATHAEDKLPDLVRVSAGGRRLERLGRMHDVTYCTQLNLLDCVPEMGEGNRMQPFRGTRKEPLFKLL
ncbi:MULTISPECIES: 2-phosphosulfolactate phosphatase [unclassified Paenibacillus]|uniref:2-phosphosulfolactate phosphatase n=1 Tax=Paenibacillus TaxID=44249 RepID=UPI0007BF73E1|nr:MULTISPECIES: 2-phosphosulfolactate phosphatase [unclassified Paenibacillus]SDK69767.1 2-phosphosulfolactate phosphatase [Paenibacillus sp. OK060]SHN82161.1 2-phosphosulfolactate phosphatase [Paenibacillus sp. ov031]